MPRACRSGLVVLYDYEWRWEKTRRDRLGDACRIVARGAGAHWWVRYLLVEFVDGERVVCQRWALRRRRRPVTRPRGRTVQYRMWEVAA